MVLTTLRYSNTLSSLSVWPKSYSFCRLEPIPEFDLRTLPFQINERVTFLRFRSSQHFGLDKVSFIRDLPNPENVTPFRFGYRFDVFPKSKLWGLVSYLNALRIPPLEFFPFLKANCFYKQFYPLITLIKKQGPDPLRTGMLNNPAYRVLTSRKVRTSEKKMLLPFPNRDSFRVLPF